MKLKKGHLELRLSVVVEPGMQVKVVELVATLMSFKTEIRCLNNYIEELT